MQGAFYFKGQFAVCIYMVAQYTGRRCQIFEEGYIESAVIPALRKAQAQGESGEQGFCAEAVPGYGGGGVRLQDGFKAAFVEVELCHHAVKIVRFAVGGLDVVAAAGKAVQEAAAFQVAEGQAFADPFSAEFKDAA